MKVPACAALLAALAPFAHGQAVAACQAPEHRRLDFWAGDWDAYDVDAPARVAARVEVASILGGCVLRERYAGVDGLEGESYTIYDAARGVWHQTWVTNKGQLLEIEGRFAGDTLTMEGVITAKDGGKTRIRASWKPENGGVRETAQTSSDGGVSWQPLFDMRFVPHAR